MIHRKNKEEVYHNITKVVVENIDQEIILEPSKSGEVKIKGVIGSSKINLAN